MAGLCGLVRIAGGPDTLDAMARAMGARGPAGIKALRVGDVGLASLVDGAEDGGVATIGGWSVALAGSLRNLRTLRGEMKARKLELSSAAEIAAHILGEVGFERALGRLEGDLSIAAWDATERRLWLARDASGLRPLHVARLGPTVAFATELTALLRHPGVQGQVALVDVQRFAVLGLVAAPRAWLPGVRAVAAGTLLRCDPHEDAELRWWADGVNPSGREGNRERWGKSLAWALDLAVKRAAEDEAVVALSSGVSSAAMAQSLSSTVPRLALGPVTAEDADELLADWPFDVPIADPAVVAWHLLAREAWKRGAPALVAGIAGAALTGRDPALARPAGLRRFRARARSRDIARARRPPLPGEESLPWWTDLDALDAAAPDGDADAVAAWLHRRLWLPDGELRAAEAACAAHGVVLRAPFADPTVVRIASQLPMGLVREGLFCEAVGVSPRPHQPLSVPVGEWMRSTTQLTTLADRLEGWVDGDHVQALVRSHRGRDADYGQRLWALCSLAAWRQARSPG